MQRFYILSWFLVAGICISGCSNLPFGSGGNSSGSSFDPNTLKGYVMHDIKMVYVDVAKAKIGEYAIRDMGSNTTQTVSVVGEKDGMKIVELTGSTIKDFASNKPAVVAMLTDNGGIVKKAWGGLVDTEGTELPVPGPVEVKGGTQGPKPNVKEEDLGEKDIVGFKARGKKYITDNKYESEVWNNKDFIFFAGILETKATGSRIVVTEYKNSGAKAQLKLPAGK